MAQTHDIEDVLSSIRRLVASETPERSEAPTADVRSGDALLLDEAQRVVEPEDPFQMIRSLAQEERDGRDAGQIVRDLPDDIAALATDIPAEPLTPWTDAEGAGADPDPTAPVADYAEDQDYQPEIAPLTEITGVEEETATEVPESAVQDAAPDTHATADAPEAEPAAERAPYDGRSRLFAGDGPSPSDGAAEDTSEQAETAAPEDDLADITAAIGGEEALRDLIAEIVRQELSGELGERITRNVRKLVRRELRQVLNAEEFD